MKSMVAHVVDVIRFRHLVVVARGAFIAQRAGRLQSFNGGSEILPAMGSSRASLMATTIRSMPKVICPEIGPSSLI